MAGEITIVRPGAGKTLLGENNETMVPPGDWSFLPAGDAGVTRKVTAQGCCWRLRVQKGRRLISLGVWAPTATIMAAKMEVEAVRESEGYKQRLAGERRRREEKQVEYAEDFCAAVRDFLAFAPSYREMELALAEAIAVHAVPVGSGTVARTRMIPLAERAALATIAWMRHQTTAYDRLTIPRVKGRRREIRRMLAAGSVHVLAVYRRGEAVPSSCPLQQALDKERFESRSHSGRGEKA